MKLEGLTKQGIRVLPFLMRGVREGLSGRRLLKMLRKYGLGYRTQNFYRDYKIVKEKVSLWDNMKYIRRDSIISERWYAGAFTPLQANYLTTVRIHAFDFNTQSWVVRDVTVAHDVLLRREDLEREAAKIAVGTSPSLYIDKAYPVRALKTIW